MARRHVARGAAIAVVLCALLVWSDAVAVAQDPAYGDVAELYYSPGEGPPGTMITITGRCLYEGRPADRAFVSLYDEPPTRNVASVSIPIDADGSVRGSLPVPTSEPPGRYRLSGLCVKDDFTIGPAITAPFRVTDVTPTTASTTMRPPTTVATTTTTTTVPATTVPPTTVPPTTVPPTTVPPTSAPTTTVASAGSVSSDGDGTALPALAAAGTVAGAAVLLVRHRRRRTPQ